MYSFNSSIFDPAGERARIVADFEPSQGFEVDTSVVEDRAVVAVGSFLDRRELVAFDNYDSPHIHHAATPDDTQRAADFLKNTPEVEAFADVNVFVKALMGVEALVVRIPVARDVEFGGAIDFALDRDHFAGFAAA